MKLRNYEKKEGIFILLFFLWIMELIGIVFMMQHKEYVYEKVSGILTNDDEITLFVDSTSRKLFYQNSLFMIGDCEYPFEIVRDEVVSQNKQKLYELVVSSKVEDKKIYEGVEVSIKKKKLTVMEIFKSVWEGD